MPIYHKHTPSSKRSPINFPKFASHIHCKFDLYSTVTSITVCGRGHRLQWISQMANFNVIYVSLLNGHLDA